MTSQIKASHPSKKPDKAAISVVGINAKPINRTAIIIAEIAIKGEEKSRLDIQLDSCNAHGTITRLPIEGIRLTHKTAKVIRGLFLLVSLNSLKILRFFSIFGLLSRKGNEFNQNINPINFKI